MFRFRPPSLGHRTAESLARVFSAVNSRPCPARSAQTTATRSLHSSSHYPSALISSKLQSRHFTSAKSTFPSLLRAYASAASHPSVNSSSSPGRRLFRLAPHRVPRTRALIARRPRLLFALTFLAFWAILSFLSFYLIPPARHVAQAGMRCAKLMGPVILDAWDYKSTFAKSYENEEIMRREYKLCHERSAKRLLKALESLGGIYIKLGQVRT